MTSDGVIAKRLNTPLYWVQQMCLFFRKQPTSTANLQIWNHLHSLAVVEVPSSVRSGQGSDEADPQGKFIGGESELSTTELLLPEETTLANNLNLLQFFLNHRRFMRSECEERLGKSPKELMTGESHPHWLELLGFKRFQQA